MSNHALPVTRAENFPDWYQAVIRDADMAEVSPVRGCMVIKQWGYGIWELLQRQLDDRIKAIGFENCYFPIFIPMSFIAKEAEHVEGFAKEMAVVTHHRLMKVDGRLELDPEARLDEPLIVRPTSETIIGDSFSRWIQSYRDLPLRINQWANIVRWEMRTRLFLRTAEFLWQEGHSAHADEIEARESTMRALELYRDFAEKILALPTIAGEKPEHERFPGAVSTYSIEAMMQDGKALQAGTSHYLGTHFAEAQNIKFQSSDGKVIFCHTSSWGLSTRMIGAVIMTHGDDDGLRCPPAIAPQQIVIVPMLRDRPEDEEILNYCHMLRSELSSQSWHNLPIRACVDNGLTKSANKRWKWITRGAPIICEVGSRDVTNNAVTFMRRDQLRENGKIASMTLTFSEFVRSASEVLGNIQVSLLAQANDMLARSVRSDIHNFDDLQAYFGESDDEMKHSEVKGWIRCSWSRPTGSELESIVSRLKALRLTIRNAPMDQPENFRTCIFTGAPGVEEILVARAY